MFRATLLATALIGFSSAAMAQPEPKTPSEAMREFKMPSPEDFAEMRKQLPDFNAIFDDMGDIMEDVALREDMARSVDIMRSRLGSMDDMRRPNGKPDLNRMFDTMFSVMGDEEFTGGLFSVMASMQEVLEKHVPPKSEQERITQEERRLVE
ncbi:hypothetical protein [Robiginitomaculum antarcticum]|uniref:hypothetical protein n=1 Tax=Robiginitomaculum antarcticum TaxID=437507 RepID=UPI00036DB06E|nr:hypothetical protein [Robiginitomaculum antarcticum]